jgi:hypothetical protein
MKQHSPFSHLVKGLTTTVATDAAGADGVSMHCVLCAAAKMQGTAAGAAAVL